MLKQIKGNSYFFDSKICIGIHIKEKKATLIDTGLDDDYARRVFNVLKDMGIEIVSIINTHSHGDHFGGNNLLKQRTNCKIYAPHTEAFVMENPIFEPIYLFGGDPIVELKDKFFMAKPSRPDIVITDEKFIGELKIIRVQGHTFNMINVLTPENVLYASDSFFSEAVLEKYKIPYLFSVEKSFESLKFLHDSEFDFFVLAHGGLLNREQARDAIKKNAEKLHEVEDAIIDFLAEKNTAEGILRFLSEKYDLYVQVAQYFLNMSIVKAFLTHLRAKGKIDCFVEGKELYWKVK